MVQFIGNSIHFNGKGILDGKLVLPNRSGVIGNGSLFKAFLPFSAGTFANASDRYITAKNPTTGLYEITGPFGANVLATRNISGDVYGLFEKQYTTADDNDYSEDMDSYFDIKAALTVTSNDRLDPLGNLTIDKICETDYDGLHYARRYFDVHNGIITVYSFIAYPDERTKVQLFVDGHLSSGNAVHIIDLDAHTYDPVSSNGIAFAKCFELSDGGTLVVLGIEPNQDSSNCRVQIYPHNGTSANYQGVVGYGFHMGFVNIIEADYPVSYIKTIGSPVTKSPDYFYFPSSAIPTWMKSKFTTKLIPNYDIPLTTEDKPLWSFNKTPSTLLTGYGYHGMAVTDTYIYWCNYGASKIQRCDLDGSNPVDLVTGASSPYDLTITATEIFWTTYSAGKIQKAPIGGGSPTDVQTGLGTLRGICNDGTDLIWTAAANEKIQKCSISGGAVTDIATGITSLSGIATDGTTIFYGRSTALYSLPIGGGTATTLATGQSVLQIVNIDENFVYWGNYGSDQVRVICKNGGAVANLADLAGVAGVAVLNGSLFYMGNDSGGTLKRRDSVTAWLTTDGKVKVVEGPDTKVETSVATASMHDNLEIEFDRANGKITLSGFTTGDGEYTDTAWSDPDGYDVEYGCALGGAAQSDALVLVPKG